MALNQSANYKVAIMASVIIHAAIIVFIARQPDRVIPLTKGIDVITLIAGGSAGFTESSAQPKKKVALDNSNDMVNGGGISHPQKQGVISADKTPDQEIATSEQKSIDVLSKETSSIKNKATTTVKSLIPVSTVSREIIEPSADSSLAISELMQGNVEKMSVDEGENRFNSLQKPVSQQKKRVYNAYTESNRPQRKSDSLKITDKESSRPIVNESTSGTVATNNERENANNSDGTMAENANEQAFFANDQFIKNSDGSYTALSPNGITYTILQDAKPKYPKEARLLGYTKIIKVQLRFLVGLNGHIESVEVVTEKIPNLGFKEEAIAAIKAMSFAPVKYKGHPIRMYFNKTIVFQG